MFIALPGLTLALDEIDQFEDVMKTAEKAIRNFINEEPVGYKIYEMEHPDVLLWAVWLCSNMPKETSREPMPSEIWRASERYYGVYPSAKT